MPTATSFAALGRGNGFPLCISKIDVSSATSPDPDNPNYNWITLGGVSSGRASEKEINQSFINAMKLYWNLHSFEGSISASGESDVAGETNSHSVEVQNKIVEITNAEDDPFQPHQRICTTTAGGDYFEQDPEQEPGEPRVIDKSTAFMQATVSTFNISRMYYGDTSDESNFLGYGMGGMFLHTRAFSKTVPTGSAASIEASVRVQVGSFLAGDTDSGEDPDNSNIQFDQVASEQSFGGIPFRALTRCESNIVASTTFGATPIKVYGLNASGLSGTIESTLETTIGSQNQFSVSIETDVSAEINPSSLEFYSYS